MKRLAGCIDRGCGFVESILNEVRSRVEDVRAVEASLDPQTGSYKERQMTFERLKETFNGTDDPIRQFMGELMERWSPGLFAGEDDIDLPEDNLDLERWFRQPKGHERRIHGRRHTGTRLVREGSTFMLMLDAHQSHPDPFSGKDIIPYCKATPPPCQQEAMHRWKVMRKARSKKKRSQLLKELEERYLNAS